MFRRAMLVGEAFLLSRVCGLNSTKLGDDIGRSFLHKKLAPVFGYLAAFSNASGSKINDVENDAKFRTFAPPPVKIRRGMVEISIPIVEALPTTEPPEYI